MKLYDATEAAYKNGYAKAKEDAIRSLEKRYQELRELLEKEDTLFEYGRDYDDGFMRGLRYAVAEIRHPRD